MAELKPTRRLALLLGAGVAAGAVAGQARAAPPSGVNVAFFPGLRPVMIAKAQRWFEGEARAKLNWVAVGNGADLNAAIAGGTCDVGLGADSVTVAAGVSEGLPYKVVGIMDVDADADGEGADAATREALAKDGVPFVHMIVARDEFGRGYPGAVAGFLKAYDRALALWLRQPEEAAAMVAAQAGGSPAEALAAMRRRKFLPLRAQQAPQWLGVTGKAGDIAQALKSTADILVAQQAILSAPGLQAFERAIDTEYLRRAIRA